MSLHSNADHRKDPRYNDDIAKRYRKHQEAPQYDLRGEELFCICRQPDLGEIMVACDGCEEWFHMRCAALDTRLAPLIAQFYCEFCLWQNKGSTLWKRKCRLGSCYEAVLPHSKYCGDQHGQEYLRAALVENGVDSLTVSDMKHVLANCADVNELHSIGTEFPELAFVSAYLADNNTAHLPVELQQVLSTVEAERASTDAAILKCEARIEYILVIRESYKRFCEELAQLAPNPAASPASRKTKQRKPKPMEPCLWDKKCIDECSTYYLCETPIDHENLMLVIREKISHEPRELHEHRLCIRDRRKCLRHNGWLNLVKDECEKALARLHQTRNRLQESKALCLRQYSIDHYEGAQRLLNVK